MMRVYARLGARLTYIGGLPTAETYAMAYLEMGVPTYSSAIFNFLPDWAVHFYRAVRARSQHCHPGAQRVRAPLYRHPQPRSGLRGFDRQGRHDSRRPDGRAGTSAAHRSD